LQGIYPRSRGVGLVAGSACRPSVLKRSIRAIPGRQKTGSSTTDGAEGMDRVSAGSPGLLTLRASIRGGRVRGDARARRSSRRRGSRSTRMLRGLRRRRATPERASEGRGPADDPTPRRHVGSAWVWRMGPLPSLTLRARERSDSGAGPRSGRPSPMIAPVGARCAWKPRRATRAGPHSKVARRRRLR
jgi:hypothetical protein